MFSGTDRNQVDPAGFHLTSREQLLFLLTHPRWIKYVRTWQATLAARLRKPDLTTLDYGLPWFTYAAIDWVTRYLKPDMAVFEYGSGGSTLFFSARVSSLVSVEHNPAWYKVVSDTLREQGNRNVELILVEPGERLPPQPYSHGSYTSVTFAEHADRDFEKYVKTLDQHPDSHFDLIVIDGRARASCMPLARQEVRPGGYILLDNSERPYYADAMSLLAGFRRTDFFGFGPLADTFWRTTIWKAPSSRGTRT